MADTSTTFKGYPADVLDRVFEAVGNPDDPAAPISALAPAHLVDVVAAAIEWYTGLPPIVVPVEDDHFLVIAEGD